MTAAQTVCYMIVSSGGSCPDDSYSYTIEVSLDKTVAELRVLALNERHEKVKKLIHEMQQRFRTWEQKNQRPDYQSYRGVSPPRHTQKAMKLDPQLKAEYDTVVAGNVKMQEAYHAALGAWMAQWYPEYCKVCERHNIEPLPLTVENHYKIQGHGFDDSTEYSVEEAPLIG